MAAERISEGKIFRSPTLDSMMNSDMISDFAIESTLREIGILIRGSRLARAHFLIAGRRSSGGGGS